MYRRVTTVGLALLFVHGLVHGQTAGQTTPADGSDPPPQLKSAPILSPPPPKALRPGIGTDRDAVFLRADRLEGETETAVQASGKVELRTRRQTVLADWLHYDFSTEEVWAKGNVVIRRGTDTITGPEAKFKRTDETGVSHPAGLSYRRERVTRRRQGIAVPRREQVPDHGHGATRPASPATTTGTSRPVKSTSIARAWSERRTTQASSSRGRPYSARPPSTFRCRTIANPDFSHRCSGRPTAAVWKWRCRTTSTSRRITTRP